MSKNEIAPAQPTSLSMTANDQATALLNTLKEIALAPDAEAKVGVMREIMTMQRELQKDQAERAINEALARLDLPHVKKNGKIPLPSKSDGGQTRDVPFAKWEDIDTVIRPLLRAEGLSLSFTAPARKTDGGGAEMTGRISHRDGAYREAVISLPLDSGPGRNNLQAMGSTISYGKKYLAFMLLNIVTEGEDNEGKNFDQQEFITIEQAAALDQRLRAVSDQALPNFLKWAKIDALTNIYASKFAAAESAVKDMEVKKAATAKKGAA